MAAGTNERQILAVLTKGCGQKTRSLALLAALTKGLQRIAQLQHVVARPKGGGATPTQPLLRD